MTDLGADNIPPHGMPATFSAQGYDPDDDQLTWTWALTPLPCADKSNPAYWPAATPSNTSPPTSYLIPGALTLSPSCVWAFASDRYGAVGADNKALIPGNTPPQAVIQVQMPDAAASYQAYTHFQLSGELSTDADLDPLTYTWRLDQVPNGSSAVLGPCADPSIATDPGIQCLDADVSGQYIASLAVSDGITSTITSMPLTVLPDRLPCIRATTPDFRLDFTEEDPTAPDPLSVDMVDDDGDPYPNPIDPTQIVTFTWFKGKDDTGALQYVDNGGSFPMLNLVPTDYAPGEVANVRVEIHDRNRATIDAILLGCGDAARCETTPGSGCYLRVSWRIKMDK